MNAVSNIVGEMIRKQRHQAGLSIEGLALSAGISPNYLGDVERGKKKPSLDTLERLLSALGISLQEFFTFGEEPHPRRDRPKVEQIAADMHSFSDSELTIVQNIVRQLMRLKNAK